MPSVWAMRAMSGSPSSATFDVGEQLPNDRLVAFEGLHEAVVGEQQGTGDTLPLVVRPGTAEELAELAPASSGRDQVAAAVDEPEDFRPGTFGLGPACASSVAGRGGYRSAS